MKYSIRKFENFHILLWLIKDLCWVVLWKPLGVFMIAPTLIFAVYITYLNKADKAELAHNLAVCFWICANSVWMIGEFYYSDNMRPYAIGLFVAGLFAMVRFYFLEFFRKKSAVVQEKE